MFDAPTRKRPRSRKHRPLPSLAFPLHLARMFACAAVFMMFIMLAPSRAPAQDAAAAPTVPVASDPAVTAESPFLWQVDRRFAAFSYPLTQADDVVALEQLLTAIPKAQDTDALHDLVMGFLKSHDIERSGAPWNAMTGHYHPAYLYPSTYGARVWLRAPGSQTDVCTWSSPGVVIQPAVATCGSAVHLTLPRSSDNKGSNTITLTVERAGMPGGGPVIASGPLQIHDRLIVSLGDSFASGEGNPDIPATMLLRDGPGHGWEPQFPTRWPGLMSITLVKGRSWLDSRCHRSYLNQHIVAALEYSAYHPEEAVTFISYACSGATIFGGVLALQQAPPGAEEFDAQVNQSQLQSLLQDLCAAPGTASIPTVRTVYKEVDNSGRSVLHPVDQASCAPSLRRPVDALLVSIGGNDIGFGGIIQDALLPHPRFFSDVPGFTLVAAARKYGTTSPEEAAKRIKLYLPTNLGTLSAALRSVTSDGLIVQSGYPSPLRAGDLRVLCGPPDKDKLAGRGDPSFSRLAALDGVWPTQFRGIPLTIDQKASEKAERLVVLPLNNSLADAAKRNGWHFVNSYRDEFLKHGWCARDVDYDDADLSSWHDPSWHPFDPSQWEAYRHRSRYFRTPNDAFLTQMPDHAGHLLDSKEGFGHVLYQILAIARLSPSDEQSALFSAFSGSFHPTFQAHVLMGKAVGSELGLDHDGLERATPK